MKHTRKPADNGDELSQEKSRFRGERSRRSGRTRKKKGPRRDNLDW
jgi:hypothetical protein